jgi:hypothetical protein
MDDGVHTVRLLLTITECQRRLVMLGACVRTVENPVNAHPTITTMKPGRRYMLQ